MVKILSKTNGRIELEQRLSEYIIFLPSDIFESNFSNWFWKKYNEGNAKYIREFDKLLSSNNRTRCYAFKNLIIYYKEEMDIKEPYLQRRTPFLYKKTINSPPNKVSTVRSMYFAKFLREFIKEKRKEIFGSENFCFHKLSELSEFTRKCRETEEEDIYSLTLPDYLDEGDSLDYFKKLAPFFPDFTLEDSSSKAILMAFVCSFPIKEHTKDSKSKLMSIYNVGKIINGIVHWDYDKILPIFGGSNPPVFSILYFLTDIYPILPNITFDEEGYISVAVDLQKQRNFDKTPYKRFILTFDGTTTLPELRDYFFKLEWIILKNGLTSVKRKGETFQLLEFILSNEQLRLSLNEIWEKWNREKPGRSYKNFEDFKRAYNRQIRALFPEGEKPIKENISKNEYFIDLQHPIEKTTDTSLSLSEPDEESSIPVESRIILKKWGNPNWKLEDFLN